MGRLTSDEQRLIAIAHALYPRPWAEQGELVCEALGIPPETLAALCQRALLMINRATVSSFGALRFAAEARLREDSVLREQIAALVAGLDENTEPAKELPPVCDDDAGGDAGNAARSGLELLTRVREALQVSAAYLQEQQDDPQASVGVPNWRCSRMRCPTRLGRPRRWPAHSARVQMSLIRSFVCWPQSVIRCPLLPIHHVLRFTLYVLAPGTTSAFWKAYNPTPTIYILNITGSLERLVIE